MGIKRLLLEPQKYRTKELIVVCLFGVILPNLNATWLLTGEGEMIQDKSTPEMPITLVSVNEYKSRLQQMEVRLEALRAQVVLKDKLLAGLLRKVENKTK